MLIGFSKLVLKNGKFNYPDVSKSWRTLERFLPTVESFKEIDESPLLFSVFMNLDIDAPNLMRKPNSGREFKGRKLRINPEEE